MNKWLLTLLVLVFAAGTLPSCRKYEEGPNISLRTKRARVTNNWAIQSALVDGIEKSQDPYWAKQKHYMYSDGKYIVTIIDPVTLEARNVQGNWKLYDSGRKIAITTKNFSGNIDSTNDYNILKLYNKQFWIRKLDNSIELHMVPFE
ncbi:MAG: hypothetical protein HWD58_03575 [Bacteroidota bacterium]|nr:hypothetical protein [Chitinophagaceae bacterium]QLH44760.1 MAG: hypothetical protein HWD58_03575 [Bacteroidota bacterium]